MARKKKVIGHSLDAAVSVSASEKIRQLLEKHREDMRVLLIVSSFSIVPEGTIKEGYESDEFKGLKVFVSKAAGKKCERCWVASETVGKRADHPTICDRCFNNLG